MNEIPPHNPVALNKPMMKKSRGMKPYLRNWELYLLISPVIFYFILFHYVPMYGILMAFQDFSVVKGVWNSDWVGMKHFNRFFDSYYFWRLINNTLGIGVYQLLVGFPVPIILALMINEVRSKYFKRAVQTVTYAPHFLSVVVVVGMLTIFLSPSNGIVAKVIEMFGGKPIAFFMEPGWFKSIYVFSGVWQEMGWSSIIYLAALTGIDPHLHEAARVDGAGRIRRIWHINIPGIAPTIMILLILSIGSIIGVGFEKIFLMQNDLNKESSDVIATYVYRSGILGAQFSFSTAVGLFNSLVNFIMLVVVNYIARKAGGTSLW